MLNISPVMTLVKSGLTERLRSVRSLILIILSGVLHGGLLFLPMPQWWLRATDTDETLEPELEDVLEESGVIAITTLPVIAEPEAEIIAPVAPVPLPEETPPAPLTQVPDNVPNDIPPEAPLDELEDLEDLEELPDPVEEPDPEPPVEKDEPLPPEPEKSNEPEAGIAVPFNADFKHVDGATTGCYGLENCLTVTGKSFKDVAREIRQQLENQGYELSPYDNDDDNGANHDIYEMRPPDTPDMVEYLNIFGDGLRDAFYVISPGLITKEDLESLDL